MPARKRRGWAIDSTTSRRTVRAWAVDLARKKTELVLNHPAAEVRGDWDTAAPDVSVYVVGVVDDVLVVDLTHDHLASDDPDRRHEGVALIDAPSGDELWSAVEVDVTWVGRLVQMRPVADGAPSPSIDEIASRS